MGDAGDELPNEGARLLAASGKSLGTVVAALKGAGVTTTKQSVHRWRRGEKVPAAPARVALALQLGIPVETWEEEPRGLAAALTEPDPEPSAAVPALGGDVQPSKARSSGLARLASPAEGRKGKRAAAAPPAPDFAPLPEDLGSAEQLAKDYLARIQGYRQGAELAKNDQTRRQWIQLEGVAITRLAKLTGQEAAPEAQLVQSPHWVRIRSAIFEALRPFPEAVTALVAKLEGLRA